MADVLLSFLTFPIGSIIELLNKKAPLGCAVNLYISVEAMSLDYIKSEECKNMLISPKLAPFSICSNNILKITEMSPIDGSVRGCFTCYWNNGNAYCKESKCVHGVEQGLLKLLNPKTFTPRNPIRCETKTGGGYSVGKVLVLNDLHLPPHSLVETLRVVSSLVEMPINNFEEKVVSLGKFQVLGLLRAALISKTPLGDVLTPDAEQYPKAETDDTPVVFQQSSRRRKTNP